MDKRKVLFVKPAGEGGWDVASQGSKRALGHFDRKPEAISRAREIAESAPLGQIKIMSRDGRIQREYTYGNDPRDFKG